MIHMHMCTYICIYLYVTYIHIIYMHMIIYVHLFKQDEVADEQRRSLHPVRMFDRSDRDNAMTKPATDRFLFITPRTVGFMVPSGVHVYKYRRVDIPFVYLT
jgi:hypothetical protein